MDAINKNQQNLIIVALVGFILYKMYESYKSNSANTTAQPPLLTTNTTLVSPALQNSAIDTTANNPAAYNVKYIAGMGKLATI
jgi:hypothetical protein